MLCYPDPKDPEVGTDQVCTTLVVLPCPNPEDPKAGESMGGWMTRRGCVSEGRDG